MWWIIGGSAVILTVLIGGLLFAPIVVEWFYARRDPFGQLERTLQGGKLIPEIEKAMGPTEVFDPSWLTIHKQLNIIQERLNASVERVTSSVIEILSDDERWEAWRAQTIKPSLFALSAVPTS